MGKIAKDKKLYGRKNARIGVLGGTFDPPHLAHIHMAESAMKAMALDYVVFMPLGVPPHGKEEITEANHRINMLKLLLADYKDFYIDTYETECEKPSYTVDSVKRINSLLGRKSKMFFIIGADSLLYLEKWYDAKTLMEITNFAVIPRPGSDESECAAHKEMLEKEYLASIKYIRTKEFDLSSTKIRENADSSDISATSAEVYKYIKENDLYKSKVK